MEFQRIILKTQLQVHNLSYRGRLYDIKIIVKS